MPNRQASLRQSASARQHEGHASLDVTAPSDAQRCDGVLPHHRTDEHHGRTSEHKESCMLECELLYMRYVRRYLTAITLCPNKWRFFRLAVRWRKK